MTKDRSQNINPPHLSRKSFNPILRSGKGKCEEHCTTEHCPYVQEKHQTIQQGKMLMDKKNRKLKNAEEFHQVKSENVMQDII